MADILTPALGESVSEATIGKWTKKAGDAVRKDEVLVELETDKVSVEVPSPVAGVLAEIIAPEGSTVGPNARLAVVTAGAVGAAPAPATATPRMRLSAHSLSKPNFLIKPQVLTRAAAASPAPPQPQTQQRHATLRKV